MKLTNKHHLPSPIVEAVRADSYTKGRAGYSVTELLSPPRLRALKEKHWDELEEDVADRIWSMLGQLMHLMLERATYKGKVALEKVRAILEEVSRTGETEIDLSDFFKKCVALFTEGNLLFEDRLYTTINGVTVSGSPDRFEAIALKEGVLEDWKFVGARKVQDGVPSEYEAQLNCYAHILREHGFTVTQIKLQFLIRDWTAYKAKREEGYPATQSVTMDVPIWEPSRVQAFLEERVAAHEAAKTKLPECTQEERWAKDTVYAVMKKGNKSAIRGGLKNTAEEATLLAAALTKSTGVGHSVQLRPGENTRCEDYCPVKNFCSQYQNLKKGGSN